MLLITLRVTPHSEPGRVGPKAGADVSVVETRSNHTALTLEPTAAMTKICEAYGKKKLSEDELVAKIVSEGYGFDDRPFTLKCAASSENTHRFFYTL